MLYKIIDNVLVSTETTEIIFQDGTPLRVEKTSEQLIGWKPLQTIVEGSPSRYEYIEEVITEDAEYIYLTYTIREKTVDEIVSINQEFWANNYFMIPISETEIYYAPHTTIMYGEVYNLLQDDLPMMLMGASAGQLTYLDMYTIPDYTQKLTKEYVASLVTKITDETKMTQIIGYMASLTFADRQVPIVE